MSKAVTIPDADEVRERCQSAHRRWLRAISGSRLYLCDGYGATGGESHLPIAEPEPRHRESTVGISFRRRRRVVVTGNGRHAPIGLALSTSFGFGGTKAVLVLTGAET
jgi:hypothetical protein